MALTGGDGRWGEGWRAGGFRRKMLAAYCHSFRPGAKLEFTGDGQAGPGLSANLGPCPHSPKQIMSKQTRPTKPRIRPMGLVH